jgi:hypothetical protein
VSVPKVNLFFAICRIRSYDKAAASALRIIAKSGLPVFAKNDAKQKSEGLSLASQRKSP